MNVAVLQTKQISTWLFSDEQRTFQIFAFAEDVDHHLLKNVGNDLKCYICLKK